jgi:hypothetical protein
MKISDTLWNSIVAETAAGIDRCRADAARHGLADKFTVTVEPMGGYAVLVTEHRLDYYTDRHAIARDLSTGDLRRARLVEKRGGGYRVEVRSAVPKGWADLATKPADRIVKALGLLDFTVILDVQPTA